MVIKLDCWNKFMTAKAFHLNSWIYHFLKSVEELHFFKLYCNQVIERFFLNQVFLALCFFLLCIILKWSSKIATFLLQILWLYILKLIYVLVHALIFFIVILFRIKIIILKIWLLLIFFSLIIKLVLILEFLITVS